MAKYKIQNWSKFHNDWVDYMTATFNATVVKHARREDAEARMERLQKDWPRETFRVVETR